jgi:hypothetical protein
MQSHEIPDEVLQALEKINLRDVISSPSMQPFILSALCNVLEHRGRCPITDNEVYTEDEEFFLFTLTKIVSRIPRETKQSIFSRLKLITSKRKLLRENKERFTG